MVTDQTRVDKNVAGINVVKVLFLTLFREP